MASSKLVRSPISRVSFDSWFQISPKFLVGITKNDFCIFHLEIFKCLAQLVSTTNPTIRPSTYLLNSYISSIFINNSFTSCLENGEFFFLIFFK